MFFMAVLHFFSRVFLLSQTRTPRRGRPGELGLVAAAKEKRAEQHGVILSRLPGAPHGNAADRTEPRAPTNAFPYAVVMIAPQNLRTFRRVVLTAMSLCFVLAALAFPSAPAAADVDDFSYDRWHGTYELSVDSNGRAHAEVTETIVARFPETNQNRGIIRGLPLRYEGAHAAPENVRVTDEHGAPVPFSVEDEDEFRAILTGDDDFVHGAQTYVMHYTLSDIVLAAEDTEVDEFYWDLVPMERSQDIAEFSAEITFAPELAEHLTGAAACYAGGAGSNTPCATEVAQEPAGADGSVTFVVPAMEAPARSGVTVAIAMQADTVTQPPARTPNVLLTVGPAVLGGAGFVFGLTSLAMIARLKKRRRSHRGVIVAQYDVPDSLPPLLAAPVADKVTSPAGAQMLHLAVTGCIRLEEADSDRGSPRPVLRVVNASAARDPMDSRAMHAIFPSLEPGTMLPLPKQSESFGQKMQALVSEGRKEATQRGYFTKERSRQARVLGFIGLALVGLAIILLLIGIVQGRELGVTALLTLLPAILGTVMLIAGICRQRVHTPAGAEAREHLEGVREFIRVAEADRLRYLQSYTGAERREDGSVSVVHLYERLLPYAMLFGMVKEWSKVLQVAYASEGVSTPYWYPAIGVHGISQLDSRLSAMTSSIQSSASYTSSSSGGSSGGGFSGGGGGGGFSGGR